MATGEKSSPRRNRAKRKEKKKKKKMKTKQKRKKIAIFKFQWFRFFFFPTDAVMATLILFLLSKSAISASFLIIYPFAGELYPTQLRGVAIGFSAYISGLGLIIIPFVTYLVSYR